MSDLPPEVSGFPSAAVEELQAALGRLRDAKGRPSTRALAAKIETSHMTVHKALTGAVVPSWRIVESMVLELSDPAKLDENLRKISDLWRAARTEQGARDGRKLRAKGLGPKGASVSRNRGDEYAEHLERYRRQVAFLHGRLRTLDFDRSRAVPIDQVFVMPAIELRKHQRDLEIIADLRQFDDRVKRAVLIGGPGTGKSTVSNMLMYRHATNVRLPVPFYVSLRAFAPDLSPPYSVVGYIDKLLETLYQCSPPSGMVQQLFKSGNALVIFDALDELSTVSNRAGVAEVIEMFSAEFPDVKVLVTSREVGYRESALDSGRFEHFRLQDFNGRRIEAYVRQWLYMEGAVPHEEIPRTVARFLSELADANVASLASNPLLLSLLCVQYARSRSVARNETEVLRMLTDLMLRNWDRVRGVRADADPVSPDLLLVVVRQLAFWVFVTRRVFITRQEIMAEATKLLAERYGFDVDVADETALDVVSILHERAGMLTDAGMSGDGECLYAFTHRTLVEYLAAVHLARGAGSVENIAAELSPHLSDSHWLNVAKLVTRLVDQTYDNGAEQLLEILFRDFSPSVLEEKPDRFFEWALDFLDRRIS